MHEQTVCRLLIGRFAVIPGLGDVEAAAQMYSCTFLEHITQEPSPGWLDVDRRQTDSDKEDERRRPCRRRPVVTSEHVGDFDLRQDELVEDR